MKALSHDPTSPPIVMCFSGLDPSGGAGLQADIQTTSAFGCHCAPIATAVTVQNSQGVHAFEPIDASLIKQQAEIILSDSVIAAFKIGMLATHDTVRTIGQLLKQFPNIPVILDPILKGGKGGPLARENLAQSISEYLLPSTSVITPNTLELEQLAPEQAISTKAVQRLIELGTQYVLLTGTHAATPQVTHQLFSSEGLIQSLDWPRLPNEYHGSGCTFAASLASVLAKGETVESASKQAQHYTWQTLYRAYQSGQGQWTPNRLGPTGPTPLRFDKYSG